MNKLMNAHNSKLSQAALSTTMSAEQKMDVLGASFVQVINESLGYVNPKNAVKHFDQFAKVNKKEIDMIMSSVEEWQGNMGEVEQILTIGKIATKTS
jgi:transcriptional regulatory protein LevR